MYMAYLCFSQGDDDEECPEATVVFKEPNHYLYEKVIPISFTILHKWTDKDQRLYK